MSDSRFLAFDFGAESGRAMLGTLAAGRLRLDEKHRFVNPHGRLNGHLHWNLLAQWQEIKTGLRKAASGGARIDGIGVDTWGLDFGLVGAGGEILGNPYMYRDARTDGVMERTLARVSKEQIFQQTGIQFMQINSLFQLIAMQEAGSTALAAARTLLFMPDLFNFLFTGIRKCEQSITSTSQMYDPRRKGWALDLLKALNLPTQLLPEIIPAGTVLGPIRADVAQECGVTGAAEIPIIAPATHDTGSAVAAVPVDDLGQDDWCYISSGTWSLMGVELAEPIITPAALSHGFTNEVGVGGTIRFLKNIMGLWPLQECRRQWASEGDELGYAEVTRLAAAAKPFGSLLDLDARPFLTPGDMPQKIAQFCRQTRQPSPAGKGETARAILESLALMYRMTVNGMEEVCGRKIRTIHIVGGGSQNELLNQMTADACGQTVLAGPVEATAIGNMLVQAMAVGKVKDLRAIRAVSRESFGVKRYEPGDGAKWEQAMARFGALMKG